MYKLKLIKPFVVAGQLSQVTCGLECRLVLVLERWVPEGLMLVQGTEVCCGGGGKQQLVLSWDLVPSVLWSGRCFREAVLLCWKSVALLCFWGSQHACWWSSEIASALFHNFMALFLEPIPEQSENQFRVANSSYSDRRNPLHFWAICVCFSCSKRSLNAHFVGVFLEFLTGLLSAGSLRILFLWIVSIELWDLWVVFTVIYFKSTILK